MGRKKYTKQFLIRLTTDELEALKSRAKEKEISISRYLVEAGLAKDKALSSEQIEREERAIYHVRKIGVNLNQIAHALNRKKEVAESRVLEVLSKQEETLKILKDVMAKK